MAGSLSNVSLPTTGPTLEMLSSKQCTTLKDWPVGQAESCHQDRSFWNPVLLRAQNLPLKIPEAE